MAADAQPHRRAVWVTAWAAIIAIASSVGTPPPAAPPIYSPAYGSACIEKVTLLPLTGATGSYVLTLAPGGSVSNTASMRTGAQYYMTFTAATYQIGVDAQINVTIGGVQLAAVPVSSSYGRVMTQYSTQIFAASGAAPALNLTNTGTGPVWVDNVRFEPLSASPPLPPGTVLPPSPPPPPPTNPPPPATPPTPLYSLPFGVAILTVPTVQQIVVKSTTPAFTGIAQAITNSGAVQDPNRISIQMLETVVYSFPASTMLSSTPALVVAVFDNVQTGSSVSYGAPAYLDDTFCGINSPTSLFTVVGTSAQRTALAAVINSNNPMISSRLATILLPNIANDNDPYRAQFMTPSGDASWVPDTLGGFVLRFTHNNTLTVRGRGAFPLHEMCHSIGTIVPLTIGPSDRSVSSCGSAQCRRSRL